MSESIKPEIVTSFNGVYEKEKIPFDATFKTVKKSALGFPAYLWALLKGIPIWEKPLQIIKPLKNLFLSGMFLIVS